MKIDGLSDDLNNTPLVKDAPDMATLVKTALNAQGLLGTSIRIPGEGASDADKAEFRGKLQKAGMVPRETFHEHVRPEKAELYAITDPPADAGKVVTQAEIDGWKKWAHDIGLSPKQFEQYAKAQIDARLASVKATQDRFAVADGELKTKYGEAGVMPAKERALAAAKRFGGQAFADHLAANPDPATIGALSEVGKLFQERGMGDLTPRQQIVETPAEAALKMAEIRNNPDHPFNNRMKAGKAAWDAAHESFMNLARIAAGERPLPAGADQMFEERA